MSPKSQTNAPVSPPPPASRHADPVLTPGASLLLDIVRLAAAVVVAWGHLTLPAFSTCLTNRMESAGAAVIVFFVLSGFVIRYVTCRRPATLLVYLIDRGSRIYSVLIPAVVVTSIVAGGFGFLHPGTLAGAEDLAVRLLQTLLFTSWSWHQQVTLPPNGALWSISFECLFYLLYGVCFYLQGPRRLIGALVAAAIAGPEVLIFFPVWLAGCLLYGVFLRLRKVALPRLASAGMAGSLVIVCSAWLLRRPLVRLYQWLSGHFHQLQSGEGHGPLHVLWPRIGHGAPISLNAYPEAAAYFILLLALLLLADRLPIAEHGPLRKALGRLAEATFPLYLFHLPIFCIAVAVAGHPAHSLTEAWLMMLLAFGTSLALAPALDHLKLALRARLRNQSATLSG